MCKSTQSMGPLSPATWSSCPGGWSPWLSRMYTELWMSSKVPGPRWGSTVRMGLPHQVPPKVQAGQSGQGRAVGARANPLQ